MKRKEKELKGKINTLESKIMNDKMDFEKEKNDIFKKQKEDQKKILADAKENTEKQVGHWKVEYNELEKKVRERDIEIKELKHSLELNKTTLENEQRMKAMKVS